MSHGCLIGWLSPALLVLMSSDSPLNGGALTTEQVSWIGAIINAGSLVGNFGYTTITKYFGRKKALCLLAIPNTVSKFIPIIHSRTPNKDINWFWHFNITKLYWYIDAIDIIQNSVNYNSLAISTLYPYLINICNIDELNIYAFKYTKCMHFPNKLEPFTLFVICCWKSNNSFWLLL